MPLSKGREAIIDIVDLPLVEGLNWHSGARYAQRRRTDALGRQHMVYLHRLIIDAPDGVWVDHIDGDGLNCRRANLRLATKMQNACNRGAPASNTSGFKGVCWDKRAGKWQASIRVNKRRVYLGLHATAELAHAAYAAAATRLHGEFAKAA